MPGLSTAARGERPRARSRRRRSADRRSRFFPEKKSRLDGRSFFIKLLSFFIELLSFFIKPFLSNFCRKRLNLSNFCRKRPRRGKNLSNSSPPRFRPQSRFNSGSAYFSNFSAYFSNLLSFFTDIDRLPGNFRRRAVRHGNVHVGNPVGSRDSGLRAAEHDVSLRFRGKF